MSARRIAAVAAAGLLSLITGVISYEHGLDVVRRVGNTGLVAYLVPLVPDLMIVTSSMTLLEAMAAKASRPVTATAALLVGIGWTVAQNVAYGWSHGVGGALVAAGIPLAFVLTFESLLWMFRQGRADAGPVSWLSQPEPAEPLTPEAALAQLVAAGSRRAVADLLGVPKSRVDRWAASVAPAAEPVPELAEASLNGDGPHGA